MKKSMLLLTSVLFVLSGCSIPNEGDMAVLNDLLPGSTESLITEDTEEQDYWHAETEPVGNSYSDNHTVFERMVEVGSAEWTDCTIKVDDLEYKLQCPLSSFIDDGWTVMSNSKEYEEMTIKPGDNFAMYFQRKGKNIRLAITNPTDSEQAYKDCIVHAISGMNSSSASKVDVAGITLDNTREEVVAKLGEPFSYFEDAGIGTTTTTYTTTGIEREFIIVYNEDNTIRYMEVVQH